MCNLHQALCYVFHTFSPFLLSGGKRCCDAFHRAETRFRRASTCQAPADPDLGQAGSRAKTMAFLLGAWGSEEGQPMLEVGTWGLQAKSLGDTQQGGPAGEEEPVPRWLDPSSLRGVVWCTVWKCVEGQLRVAAVLEATLKAGFGVKVNRRKSQYGERPLPGLLWKCLQPGRSPRQKTGQFFSKETHQPSKKPPWSLPC